MAKATSVKAPAPQQVNKWDEKLAQYATDQSAKETVGGTFLSFKSGILAFGGAAIPGGKLDIVVLGDTHENAYYDKPYDADNPVSPACFAFSVDGKDMAPHPDAADPQNDKCATCQWNKFGSADNKKGKKCRNLRRIAFISGDALDDVAGAELAFAKIPPTSVDNFSSHTKRVNDTIHRPLWATISTISCAPHLKKQVELSFGYKDKVTDSEQLGALETMAEGILSSLEVPYTYNTPEEAQPTAPTPSATKVKGKR